MNLSEFFLLVPAILIAVTIHELAHAYVALWLGDPTAKNAGRLTLNPLSHLDLFGTIMFIVAKVGWAKPVPVNPVYFKDPVKDMAKVAVAGPVANLLLAILTSFILKATETPDFISEFLYLCTVINVGLAIFNFLPIPPLDGAKILPAFLSPEKAMSFYKFEPYGILLLFALLFIFDDLFHLLISHPIQFILNALL